MIYGLPTGVLKAGKIASKSMDPLSMAGGMFGGGLPGFSGGDAGPAFSRSDGNQQGVNALMTSPFSVGSGSASTEGAVSAGVDGAGLPTGVGSQIASLAPLLIAGAALFVLLKVKK